MSEARGTTRPFELCGAPWVSPEPFCDALNARTLPGVHFRPHAFEPVFQKHAKTSCGGCQIHVTDRSVFRPVETGVTLIEAFRNANRAQFKWRTEPYEYEFVKPPIDIMYGSARLREGLERGESAQDIAASWTEEVEDFKKLRADFLLYQ